MRAWPCPPEGFEGSVPPTLLLPTPWAHGRRCTPAVGSPCWHPCLQHCVSALPLTSHSRAHTQPSWGAHPPHTHSCTHPTHVPVSPVLPSLQAHPQARPYSHLPRHTCSHLPRHLLTPSQTHPFMFTHTQATPDSDTRAHSSHPLCPCSLTHTQPHCELHCRTFLHTCIILRTCSPVCTPPAPPMHTCVNACTQKPSGTCVHTPSAALFRSCVHAVIHMPAPHPHTQSSDLRQPLRRCCCAHGLTCQQPLPRDGQ